VDTQRATRILGAHNELPARKTNVWRAERIRGAQSKLQARKTRFRRPE
jgi:hypothetical protein